MLVLMLLAGAGCSPEAEPPAAITAVGDAPSPVETATPQDRVTLPAGQVLVELVDGRASVHANRAPRDLVLKHLAGLGDFRIVTGPVPDSPLTVDARNTTLEEAIALVLAGAPYTLRYQADPAGGRSVLAEVRVGPPGNEPSAVDAARTTGLAGAATREPEEPPPAPLPPDTPPGRVEAELASEWQAANPDTGWQLKDSATSVRIEAVKDVDPERGGIVVLAQVLGQDPDPKVRTAALRQLNESESMVARQAILSALRDPDPAVVLAALDIVEYWDDGDLVPGYLEPLRLHPDPAVRQRVADAIDYLE